MLYYTQSWTKAQFQAYVNWLWLTECQVTPATAKAFMKTSDFKSAK